MQPGQTLTVTAAVHERGDREYVFKGSGTVDGKSTFSARVTLEQFNLADRNAALAKSDQSRIEEFRRHLLKIWTPPDVAVG